MKAIIFIGIQASGKTSFFKQELEKDGFVHISTDITVSRNTCLQLGFRSPM